jgi:hypothetical protein
MLPAPTPGRSVPGEQRRDPRGVGERRCPRADVRPTAHRGRRGRHGPTLADRRRIANHGGANWAERHASAWYATQVELGRKHAGYSDSPNVARHGPLLGGGLAASGVYGEWHELTGSTLVQGNVPGLNNPFDVLGELLQKRLSAGSLRTVFPGDPMHPLGLAKT